MTVSMQTQGAAMLQNILVGYDGSAQSRRAYDFAVAAAAAFGGRVHVVMALTLPSVEPGAAMLDDRRYGEAVQALAVLVANHDPHVTVTTAVIHGSPGDVLLAEATRQGSDHIVLGHTPRGALLTWLLGSVTSDVMGAAPMPVTVLR